MNPTLRSKAGSFRVARLLVLLVLPWVSFGLHGAEPAATNRWPDLKEVIARWETVPREEIEKRAESGELTAMHYLGYCLVEGLRFEVDADLGMAWYRRAGDAGYMPSVNNLGVLHLNGKHVPKDLAEAHRLFRFAADRGTDQSQMNLGVLHRDGTGVAPDPREALKWFRLAAAQGHAAAMVEVGRAYRFGRGVPMNASAAEEWFRKAIAARSPIAEANLAFLKESQRDYAAAFPLFLAAAKKGNLDAMCALHWAYSRGEGVHEDQAEALRWLRRSAEGGHMLAQYRLGRALRDPRIAPNPAAPSAMAEAVSWYRKAAEQGSLDALHAVAECQLRGLGTEPDEALGLETMRAAADRGHLRAMFDLAELYESGAGAPRSPSETPQAIYERLSAGSEAVSRAIESLVFRHQFGIGTPRNLVAASHWYCRGAAAGTRGHSLVGKDVVAAYRRAVRSSYGHFGQPGIDRTVLGDTGPTDAMLVVLADYLKAAAHRDKEAARRIAERYFVGNDAPRDEAAAWCWLTLAARFGDSTAKPKLAEMEKAWSAAERSALAARLELLVEQLRKDAEEFRSAQ